MLHESSTHVATKPAALALTRDPNLILTPYYSLLLPITPSHEHRRSPRAPARPTVLGLGIALDSRPLPITMLGLGIALDSRALPRVFEP